jgi:hypothetical protein
MYVEIIVIVDADARRSMIRLMIRLMIRFIVC